MLDRLLITTILLVALPASSSAQSGAELVRVLGCGACHQGIPSPDAIRESAPPLGATIRPLPPEYVFFFLANPIQVRPDIDPARMPTFLLEEEERLALALFLSQEGAPADEDPAIREAIDRHPDASRALGRAVFGSLKCGGCHSHPEVDGNREAPNLARASVRVREEWMERFLRNPVPVRPAGFPPGSGSRMPDFRLSEGELDAVVSLLQENSAAGPGYPPYEPDRLSPFSMAKAEALIREELPCLGCHQLGEEGGRIGPSLDGVGQRLRPGVVRAIIHDPASALPGTIMPRSPLPEERADLISAFLLQRRGDWSGSEVVTVLPPPLPASSSSPPGEELYRKFCVHCHGQLGRGDGYNAPFLPGPPTAHADSIYMSTRTDDTLFDGIYSGGRFLDRSHRMPAFGSDLSGPEIRKLVRYIRALCLCRGPAGSG
jgi:mono/diheme cytochrome c family protein